METPAEVLLRVQQDAFIEAFEKTALIEHACRAARIPEATVRRWRKEDPDFAERYEDAIRYSLERIEAEALRRAVDGVDEPIVHRGQIAIETEYVIDSNGELKLDDNGMPITKPVIENGRPKYATVKKYSDMLLAKALEAKVAAYQRAQKVELSGPDGGPMELATSKIDVARRIAFALKQGLKEAEARRASGEDLV
jgi:hypothetical protein